jgi:hypothetical protein
VSSTQQGSGSAVRACQEYERWASEVRRLTEAIKGIVCPIEGVPAEDGLGTHLSHFAAACDVRVDMDGPWDEAPAARRLTLEEIEPRVADCPKCSELVDLIRARRHARKQFGVAKRRVRQVGKALTPT